jgi:hypothetical protein
MGLRGLAGRDSLGGARMGFAWIAEGARQGFGWSYFDPDFDDDDLGGGVGSRGYQSRAHQVGRKLTGPGRHVRPKDPRLMLGGLGLSGGFLRTRSRRQLPAAQDPIRRVGSGRGAHAARSPIPGAPAAPASQRQSASPAQAG